MSDVAANAVGQPGHLFPRYHVRPPRGYLNDPNGPLYLDGRYHLYFQDRVSTDLATPVLWGHATSTDLVHWQHHRPALVPSPVRADRDGCWSGNTVVDDHGNVHAFYSGLRNDHPFQSVLSAISTDGGFSFGEPRQVVDDPAEHERIVTFRDPFVWRDGERWSMIVGAGDVDGVASVRLYDSEDLHNWTFRRLLARSPRRREAGLDTGEMWECPQLVHLAGDPVLLAGAWTDHDGTMDVYAITGLNTAGAVGTDGSGPELEFAMLDHGPDFYAASVLRDSPLGPLVWGWAREARDHAWCVEDGWSGVLTLPRMITAGRFGGVAQAPVPGLEQLRIDDGSSLGPDGLDDLPAQLELGLTAPRQGRSTVRLILSAAEELIFTLDRDRHAVIIDRSSASTDPRAVGGVVEIHDAFGEGAADVRVFLDGSLVEVFTGTGRVATLRCYPTTPPPYRLEVVAAVEAPGADVRVWRLGDGQQVLQPTRQLILGA